MGDISSPHFVTMTTGEKILTVGVLAMQGAFREHYHHIERLNPLQASKTSLTSEPRLKPLLVRNNADLEQCDALIIPGGESTAIALGAQRAGLLEPLRDWVAEGRPTWGTCAGMILLARETTGSKRGGQDLLGGMDMRVGRNGFGSQVDSFESALEMPCLAGISHGAQDDSQTFPGVFIRAPIIDSLLLPKDLDGLAPSEPARIARGAGEPHDKLDIQRQSRLPDGKRNGEPGGNGNAPSATAADLLAVSGVRQKLAGIGRSQSENAASNPPMTLSVAPPLDRAGSSKRPRPPLEVLAALPTLPRGARASIGGGNNAPEEGLVGLRPEHDSMIIALKQGNLMCTSFHPELTADGRLHEFFVRRCALGQTH